MGDMNVSRNKRTEQNDPKVFQEREHKRANFVHHFIQKTEAQKAPTPAKLNEKHVTTETTGSAQKISKTASRAIKHAA